MTGSKPGELPSLYDAYKDHFLIGAAVGARTLTEERDLLIRHYNSLTAENEMKFERLQAVERQYTFDFADRMLAFAKQYGKKVRGHTLVWHNQTPKWVFEDGDGNPVDHETLLLRMKSHIHTAVGRFQGEIYAWDVVNEAVSDKGEEHLRPSPWLDIVGESFIAKAFEYAHEADPQAQLFYNDYNECVPDKREKIYKLVRSLKENGTPIHGIGLQAHWNLDFPSTDDIRRAIERYASLGLILHITELDISVFRHEDRRIDLTAPTEQMLERQASRYRQIFELFKEYSEHIKSVTFWGVSDRYTWLNDFPVRGRQNWPFVFDAEHRPKASFWKLIEVASKIRPD